MLHNDYVNKYSSVTPKGKHKKSKIIVSTCILLLILMLQIIRHTIKVKGSSSIKCTPQSQQMNLHHSKKIKYRSNKGYNNNVQPGPLCDVKDLGDTQDFD